MLSTVNTQFKSLADVLQFRSEISPDQNLYTFLKDGETVEASYTYSELMQKSKAIAATLQQLAAPGDRALLLFQPGIDFISAFYGCLLAGIVAVPAYPPNTSRIRTSLPRLLSIIKDSGAKVSLTTSDILPAFQPFMREVPDLQQMLWQCTDAIQEDRARYWFPTSLEQDDLAFLQYTSGSTGQPKGVMVSHGNILYNEEMIRQALGVGEGGTFVGWLPLYHDMGLIANLIQPLYSGTESILMSPLSFLKRPIRWLKAIEKYGASVSGGPNFAYELCLKRITDEEKAGLDLSCWRKAFNGAEPVRKETLDRFAEAFAECGFNKKAIYPCYGLAEATLIVTGSYQTEGYRSLLVEKKALENDLVVINPLPQAECRELVSSGCSVMEQEVVIADPVVGVKLEDLQVGEIWVKGQNVAKGYFNNAEKTEETFQARLADDDGPYLRTGDLGFLHEGHLYVTGRIKDLIKVRGRGIYPSDIEKLVEGMETSYPEIRFNGCAAFSVEGESGEEVVLITEVAPRRNPLYDPEQLTAAILDILSSEMEIRLRSLILIQSSIPKTSSGKKMRHACRKNYLSDFDNGDMKVIRRWDRTGQKSLPTQAEKRPQVQAEPTAKPDLKKEQLVVMLQEWIAEDCQIDLPEVKVDKPFTEFGMDSLSVVTLIDYLERRLGMTLNQELVFEYKNIDQLSEYLLKA